MGKTLKPGFFKWFQVFIFRVPEINLSLAAAFFVFSLNSLLIDFFE